MDKKVLIDCGYGTMKIQHTNANRGIVIIISTPSSVDDRVYQPAESAQVYINRDQADAMIEALKEPAK